jgi:hypothetical protein
VTWAAGELERAQLFYEQRAARVGNRARLEAELLPASFAPYLAAQANFAALVRDALQHQQPPEEEFPDSLVVVNQNLY